MNYFSWTNGILSVLLEPLLYMDPSVIPAWMVFFSLVILSHFRELRDYYIIIRIKNTYFCSISPYSQSFYYFLLCKLISSFWNIVINVFIKAITSDSSRIDYNFFFCSIGLHFNGASNWHLCYDFFVMSNRSIKQQTVWACWLCL